MINIKIIKAKFIIYTLIFIIFLIITIANAMVTHLKETAKQAALAASAKYAFDMTRLKARHKKELAQVKLKQRAKARVQRGVAAIPILGIGSLAAFETLEFQAWQQDNPNGTFKDYSQEMSMEVKKLLMDEYAKFSEYTNEILETIVPTKE